MSERLMSNHKHFITNLARSVINTENKFRVKSTTTFGLNLCRKDPKSYAPVN
jgi:hypothetical protein